MLPYCVSYSYYLLLLPLLQSSFTPSALFLYCLLRRWRQSTLSPVSLQFVIDSTESEFKFLLSGDSNVCFDISYLFPCIQNFNPSFLPFLSCLIMIIRAFSRTSIHILYATVDNLFSTKRRLSFA